MRALRLPLWKSSAFAALVLSAGCTTMLGIDGEYVAVQASGKGAGGRHGDSDAASGGVETGGFIDVGGAGSGGAETGGTGSGGATALSCSRDAATCPTGDKCCTGVCVAPAPLIGCSLDGCTPCPEPPANGVAVCNGALCGIECNPGFVMKSGACIATASGGATGAGGRTATGGRAGTGGAPAPTCDAKKCPGCVPVGPFGCCKNNGTCGCTWAPGAICY
jgi:hypothetical protein